MFIAIRMKLQDFVWNRYVNAPDQSRRELFWLSVYDYL